MNTYASLREIIEHTDLASTDSEDIFPLSMIVPIQKKKDIYCGLLLIRLSNIRLLPLINFSNSTDSNFF